MSAITMPTKPAGKAPPSSGCGCGCGGQKPWGGSSGAPPCTCECQPPVCPESGIYRPNFFAGQLLTEEDLQQITVYSSGKRRLTNRYVFGTGVVCGLAVCRAGPQAPGSIIVEPGYALDCCGNDIVLSCPYTIDVNAMMQVARARLRRSLCSCLGRFGATTKIRALRDLHRVRQRSGQPLLAGNDGDMRQHPRAGVVYIYAPLSAADCKPRCDLGSCLEQALAKCKDDCGYSVDLARWRDLARFKRVVSSRGRVHHASRRLGGSQDRTGSRESDRRLQGRGRSKSGPRTS